MTSGKTSNITRVRVLKVVETPKARISFGIGVLIVALISISLSAITSNVSSVAVNVRSDGGSTLRVVMPSDTRTATTNSLDFDLSQSVQRPAAWSDDQAVAIEIAVTSTASDATDVFRGAGDCKVDVASGINNTSFGDTQTSLVNFPGNRSIWVLNDRTPQLSLQGKLVDVMTVMQFIRFSCSTQGDLVGKFLRVGAVPTQTWTDPSGCATNGGIRTCGGPLFYLFSTQHYYQIGYSSSQSATGNTMIQNLWNAAKSQTIDLDARVASGATPRNGWMATLSSQDEITLTRGLNASFPIVASIGATDAALTWTWDTTAWGAIGNNSTYANSGNNCQSAETDFRWLGPDSWCLKIPNKLAASGQYWNKSANGQWQTTTSGGSPLINFSAADSSNGYGLHHSWGRNTGANTIQEPNGGSSENFVYQTYDTGEWDDSGSGTWKNYFVEYCDPNNPCAPTSDAVSITAIAAPAMSWTTIANQCYTPGLAANSISLSLSVSGGVPNYTFTATNLPSFLSISGSTITNNASTVTGEYSFSVRATDQNSTRLDNDFSLSIKANCGVTWTVNGTSVGYAGNCTAGAYTQTVYNDATGTYIVGRFVAAGQVGAENNGSCSFRVPANVTSLTYLAVGGGGGGGQDGGGGGGGGGLETSTSYSVAQNDLLTIRIGAGGLGGGTDSLISESGCPFTDGGFGDNGDNGQATTIVRNRTETITALGGGGGAGRCNGPVTGATIANTGGAGHKWYASGPGDCQSSNTCNPATITRVGTQRIGGRSLQYAGGGGASSREDGGSAVWNRLNASRGGLGLTQFADTPLEGIYGPGGGGGTWCRTTSDCSMYTQGTNPNFTRAPGGGAGGEGGTGLAAVSTLTTNNTGGGGSGGGGFSVQAGGSGAAGVVFLQWRVSVLTSQDEVTIHRTIYPIGTLSSTGTLVLQYADLNESVPSCGTWETFTTTSTLANDTDFTYTISDSDPISTTNLLRGNCYRWTQDNQLAGNSVAPTDSSSTAFGNLTSPIIMIPSRVDVNLPTVLLVDPRSSIRNFSVIDTVTGPNSAQFCFYENETDYIGGNGFGTNSPTQSLKFGSNVIANAKTNSSDRSDFTNFNESGTAMSSSLSSIRISNRNGSLFSGTKYILIRGVPFMPGFVSDCSGAGAGRLNSSTSEVWVVKLVAYDLAQTSRRGVVPLKS